LKSPFKVVRRVVRGFDSREPRYSCIGGEILRLDGSFSCCICGGEPKATLYEECTIVPPEKLETMFVPFRAIAALCGGWRCWRKAKARVPEDTFENLAIASEAARRVDEGSAALAAAFFGGPD
jgi:hypothetical protein